MLGILEFHAKTILFQDLHSKSNLTLIKYLQKFKYKYHHRHCKILPNVMNLNFRISGLQNLIFSTPTRAPTKFANIQICNNLPFGNYVIKQKNYNESTHNTQLTPQKCSLLQSPKQWTSHVKDPNRKKKKKTNLQLLKQSLWLGHAGSLEVFNTLQNKHFQQTKLIFSQ